MIGAGLGITCTLLVLLGTGRLFGSVIGAGDNGDGPRLYCGAGLVPMTPDSSSAWKGGVVLNYSIGDQCPEPIPSSALPILRLSTFGSSTGYSLSRLAWVYASLIGIAAAIVGWACTRIELRRVAVLAPVFLPLAIATFARFFTSTYSEPAGLLGVVVLFSGIGVAVATDCGCRSERLTALGLMAIGTFLAATAKVSYVPIAGVGVLACLLTPVTLGRLRRRWIDHLPGLVAAGILLLALIMPVSSAFTWQREHTLAVNAHNLIYTTVLVEVRGAAQELGLPAEASEFAGRAFYPDGPGGVVGADRVAASPSSSRSNALAILIRNPVALFRSIGIGLQSTMSTLDYLPSSPWSIETTPAKIGTSVGEEGADNELLRSWLDHMMLPWVPSALVLLGLGWGTVGLFARRHPWSMFAVLAGAAAMASLLLVVTAVLGDGYFEIAKHVWLASYLLVVSALAQLGALACLVAGSVRGLFAARSPSVADCDVVFDRPQ